MEGEEKKEEQKRNEDPPESFYTPLHGIFARLMPTFHKLRKSPNLSAAQNPIMCKTGICEPHQGPEFHADHNILRTTIQGGAVMKTITSGSVAALICTLAFSTACFAEESQEKNEAVHKPRANAATWDKVDKLRAEAEEAKAMADKVAAETRLQEAMLKRKMVEELFKIHLEAEQGKMAAQKAQAESDQAKAQAETLEARLHAMKAATKIKVLEQASQTICDSEVVRVNYEKIEQELKLAKLQHEKDSIGKN